jgi:hypothetical protein
MLRYPGSRGAVEPPSRVVVGHPDTITITTTNTNTDRSDRVAIKTVVSVGGGVLAAAVVAIRAGRGAGSLPVEVRAVLPGDELLADAGVVSTQAVRIAAPPEQVWPWLVQMGYGRGGWYAIDRLERLIGAGDFLTGGSATSIVPELQHLAVGDRVPMSATVHLVVARLEAPRVLVLVLPTGPLAWVWSFVLTPDGDGTRLVVRTRTAARAMWMRPAVPVLDAGHLVMQAVQLRRLRGRVESAVSGHMGDDRGVQPR